MSAAEECTHVEIPKAALFDAVERMLELVSTMQAETQIDHAQMLVVVLYATGFWIGAGGGQPKWDAQVGAALPPMLDGWRMGQKCREKNGSGVH